MILSASKPVNNCTEILRRVFQKCKGNHSVFKMKEPFCWKQLIECHIMHRRAHGFHTIVLFKFCVFCGFLEFFSSCLSHKQNSAICTFWTRDGDKDSRILRLPQYIACDPFCHPAINGSDVAWYLHSSHMGEDSSGIYCDITTFLLCPSLISISEERGF